MVIVLGVITSAFLVALLVGAVSGRVTIRSCCAVADPRRDVRMRGAFGSEVVETDIEMDRPLPH